MFDETARSELAKKIEESGFSLLLVEQLRVSADLRGLSPTQEICRRLEESFQRETHLDLF